MITIINSVLTAIETVERLLENHGDVVPQDLLDAKQDLMNERNRLIQEQS